MQFLTAFQKAGVRQKHSQPLAGEVTYHTISIQQCPRLFTLWNLSEFPGYVIFHTCILCLICNIIHVHVCVFYPGAYTQYTSSPIKFQPYYLGNERGYVIPGGNTHYSHTFEEQLVGRVKLKHLRLLFG